MDSEKRSKINEYYRTYSKKRYNDNEEVRKKKAEYNKKYNQSVRDKLELLEKLKNLVI